jgi:two-component system CheB/CheR fusion protein
VAQPFPIIGIGASAGGIDALKIFFSAMPRNPGAAFVVVVHMPPEHRTLLGDVLSSLTPLPVATAEEGMEIAVDHVYVSPSGSYVTLSDGRFNLLGSQGDSLHHPIDRVFESLAEQAAERAIGVVLSGAGNDGTAGARAIALAGGRVFAQSPATAAHESMPREVAAAVPACRVGPPDVLAQEIFAAMNGDNQPHEVAALDRILTLVREKTGRDFSGYKPRSLLRRIARRMDFLQLADSQAYLDRLGSDSAEAAALADFLVIGVTEFFRDTEIFTFLCEQALPDLLRRRGPADRLRAWVAGCSTGEEAYSLAILLLELAESSGRHCEVKVFATDIDTGALDYARSAVYEPRTLQGVSPERLARFFEQEPDGYRVGKRLRDCVVFSVHNLLSDPPFSHLDLVSCRNVLIYLDAARQASILPLFHYALDPEGLLLLGPSETIGRFDYGFETISKKWRLFRKLPVKLPVRLNPPHDTSWSHEPPRLSPRESRLNGSVGQRIREALATDFAPAVVAVDRGGRIVHYSGPIDRFLALPAGPADHSLAAMVRSGLRRAVRRLFDKVWEATGTRPITSRATLRGPTASVVRISAKRIGTVGSEGPLAMLVFEDCGPATPARDIEPISDNDEAVIRELELELEEVRGELQANIEALITSNEELRTSNEEVLSTNEELQATNEELETSKEEIQSVNEELSSVNTQLGMKVDELAKANDDMANLLACTDVATLFLDHDYRIKHFTPAATRLFRLIPSDMGRPLTDVVWQFQDPALLADAAIVLDKLAPREAMANTADGHFFIRRIAPYRSSGNHIGGVVLTFVDVTEIHRALAALKKRAHQLELMAQLSARAFVTTDPLEFVERCLAAICDVSGTGLCHFFAHEDGGKLVLRRALGWPETEMEHVAGPNTDVARALVEGGTVLIRDFSQDNAGRGPVLTGRVVNAGVAVAVPGPQRPYGIIGTYSDKTDFIEPDAVQWVETIAWLLGMAFDRHATEAALRNTSAVFMESHDPIVIEDGDGAITDMNEAAEEFFGWPRRELIGKPIVTLFADDGPLTPEALRDRSVTNHGSANLQATLVTASGQRMPVLRSVSALSQGEPHGWTYASIFTDISPLKRAEAKLLEARHIAEQTSAEKTRFLSAVSHDLRQPLQALRLLMEVLNGSAEGQTKKVVGHMDEALQAAENQLTILMDVSALETGSVRAFLSEIDLDTLLTTIASICTPEAEAKGLVLKLHHCHRSICGDRALLERMVRNLVINAIRHTSTGKVLLGCRKRGERIHIEVWDTGPGIPEDKQIDIFEDFYQLGNPERDRRKGYGLGLSIVGRLAKMLGYGVNLRSKVGKGTVFTITIPSVPLP